MERRRFQKRGVLIGGALACVLALGACGESGSTTTATQAAAPPQTAPASTPAVATTPQASGAHVRTINETAQLVLTRKLSLTHYRQRGTISGTFAGTMMLDAQLGSKGVVVRFTAQLPGGSVSGHGLAIIQINGAALDPLTGTASITRGTGAFAHARASGLKVTGKAALDGSKAVVKLAGTVTY